MPRPTTKKELLQAADENYTQLIDLIDLLSPDVQEAVFAFDDRDRTIRDILIHLHEWHILLLNWVEANRRGESAPFLPSPYTWKTYAGLNIEFWTKHQTTLLGDARAALDESHHAALALIESFTGEELFTKKYFSWTGTTSVGSYCVSATSSHYAWAMKKVRKHKKTQR